MYKRSKASDLKRTVQNLQKPGIAEKARLPAALFFIVGGLIGFHYLFVSHAATYATAFEAEKGTLAGNTSTILDTKASGDSAVKFGSSSTCTVSAILVNSCRPLLGAAARGYPQPASNGLKDQAFYHEQRIGHELDLIHDYHSVGDNSLTADEKYFATRVGTTIYANWKPASPWNAISKNNAEIDSMANSIKSIAPYKIFLALWHEPENDVTYDPNCPSVTYKGNAGTPTDYRNMWSYVHNRFATDGVTNVVWVMNYMNYKSWQCLVPDMYPGNNLVDWVTFEAYGGSEPFNQKVSDMYNLLTADTDSTHNFTSKPWGLGEWGVCNNSPQSEVYKYYDDAKTALDNNTFPRLKLYQVYDDNGNNAGMGCLTEYNYAGQLDTTEQQHYNAFADDPIFLKK